jgi:hypothetical protein
MDICTSCGLPWRAHHPTLRTGGQHTRAEVEHLQKAPGMPPVFFQDLRAAAKDAAPVPVVQSPKPVTMFDRMREANAQPVRRRW